MRLDATRCRANAHRDSEFCFFHDPALGKERTAAPRAGDIARTRPVVFPSGVPSRELWTAGDVVALLAETINHGRKEELDLRAKVKASQRPEPVALVRVPEHSNLQDTQCWSRA